MKIIETRHWTAEDVRLMCIRENFYTLGDCYDYDNMLDTVSDKPTPTIEDIYQAAEDINRHTAGQTVENIMFILANDVVKSCFEIEE